MNAKRVVPETVTQVEEATLVWLLGPIITSHPTVQRKKRGGKRREGFLKKADEKYEAS